MVTDEITGALKKVIEIFEQIKGFKEGRDEIKCEIALNIEDQ